MFSLAIPQGIKSLCECLKSQISTDKDNQHQILSGLVTYFKKYCFRNQTLHWQAIGNPRCQGTWKKVRRVDHCSCPAVHSFIFI